MSCIWQSNNATLRLTSFWYHYKRFIHVIIIMLTQHRCNKFKILLYLNLFICTYFYMSWIYGYIFGTCIIEWITSKIMCLWMCGIWLFCLQVQPRNLITRDFLTKTKHINTRHTRNFWYNLLNYSRKFTSAIKYLT